MKRVVVKFGGASIGSGELVLKAASSVYEEFKRGAQVVVVASAMGDATDELINAARTSTRGKISAREMDDIMAMGERTSVRIFAASLSSLGARAKYVDPSSEEWPVITDSSFGGARVDLEETKRKVKEKLQPMLEKGVIPVVCGFLGKDKQGNITTLGRGGSDITALLLASCLGANEVVFVKDVEGILSGDPSKVRGTQLIEEISAEEMRNLAAYGAKVLHPRALNYKDPSVNAKVIHFRHGNLSARGTWITGPRGEWMGVRLHEEPLAMLTVVGERLQEVPGILARVTAPLSEARINILGVSIGPRSFSLYVAKRDSQRALEILHGIVAKHELMKSVTSEDDVAMLVTESEKFIETPGMIAQLTKPLAQERINIIEIFSSKASITFFVGWADRERALEILKQKMKEVGA